MKTVERLWFKASKFLGIWGRNSTYNNWIIYLYILEEYCIIN